MQAQLQQLYAAMQVRSLYTIAHLGGDIGPDNCMDLSEDQHLPHKDWYHSIN